jgi:hypothetical protein
MPMMKPSPVRARILWMTSQEKAHAVLETAAVAVVPAVRPGRPELIDQGVVGGEQLDPVEARRVRPPRGLREALDAGLDLGQAHGVAAVLVVVGRQARGRPAGRERVVRVAVLADVVELLDHDRAVLVAGIGQAAEMRDHRIVAVTEVAARQHRRLMHRHRLDHDHGGPAQRPLQVVVQVTLARQPAFGHVRRVGTEGEPVLQPFVAEIQRLEEVWERR